MSTSSRYYNREVVGPADNFYSLQDPRLADVLRGYGSAFTSYGSATPTWLTMNSPADYLGAWEKCPPVVSIICNKAQADINGRVAFFKAGTQEEIKPTGYNPTIKALKKLFDKPNPMQTWRQFRAQQKIYTQLFGICPVLMVRPVGFDTDVPKMMWNIPPQLVKITTTGKLFYQMDASNIISKVEVELNGQVTQLEVKNVLFLRDQTISLNSEVLPDSRLKTLSYPISNIVAAYEAANVLITKRGALGIFSNTQKDKMGFVPIMPDDKAQLQQDLQGYGLSHSQSQFIVTTAGLQWQQIGVNAKELMLNETIKASIETICDLYGHPFELLANEKGTTFANKKEAKASFYQDTIMPEAAADMEVFTGYLALTDTGFDVRLCFDHVEVLQKSQLDAAEERKAGNEAYQIEYDAGVITLDDWREMNGLPRMNTDPFTLYKHEMTKYMQDNGLLPDMTPKNDNNGPDSAQNQ